ncbi:MAG: InlB B-repeat-containing protein [Clostridia bacterium]|nr:InlB B-repeat-containing protein [Clostridia bacterium]
MNKRRFLALLLLCSMLFGMISCLPEEDDDEDVYEGDILLHYYVNHEDPAGEMGMIWASDGWTGWSDFPKRFGYRFMGFYLDPDFQTLAVDTEGEVLQYPAEGEPMYSRWEPHTFHIQFEVGTDCKLLSEKNEIDLLYGSTVESLPLAEKEGLLFVGWKDVNGNLVSNGGEPLPAHKLFTDKAYVFNSYRAVLSPVFRTDACIVTFDYNDGTGKTETLEVPRGTYLTESQFPQMDDGTKRIAAWSLYSGGMSSFTEEINGDITLYASWQRYKQVTLNDTVGKQTTVYVYETQGFDLLSYDEIFRPGYLLEGWYDNAAYSGNPISNLTYETAAETYYAKWTQATYVIDFDKLSAGESIASFTYQMGESIALRELSRTGYTFEGWCTREDLSDPPIKEITSEFWGSYTLYAKFTPDRYTLSLMPEGGALDKDGIEVDYGGFYQLPVPVRAGSTFLGWFDGTGKNATAYTDTDGKALQAYPHLSNITLYAHWSVQTFTVRFDFGNGTEESYVYSYGDRLHFPNEPVKEGMFFAGWYDRDYVRSYDTNTPVTSDLVLCAKWSETNPLAVGSPLYFVGEVNGIVHFRGHYYKVFKITSTWDQAQSLCASMGGHLVTLTSRSENDFVFQLCKSNGTHNYHLGATDRSFESVWQWVTGEEWDYANFAPSEPGGGTGENYLAFWTGRFDGSWVDYSGQGYFVCEWETQPDLLSGMGQYNGNAYRVFAGSYSWDQAKALCEALGGHLATLTTAGEDRYVYQLCKSNGALTCYLGASDREAEGEWKWVTGEKWEYSRFAAGEPSSGRSENFLSFYSGHTDGGWNDYSGSTSFVCEWEAGDVDDALSNFAYVISDDATYNGAFYYAGHLYQILSAEMDYEAAQAYCQSLGGHLATVETAEENAALYSYISRSGNIFCALGGSDKDVEGTWVWVNGTPVPATNWATNEPNNASGAEHYLYFAEGGYGTWNDTTWRNRFLCEWDYCPR